MDYSDLLATLEKRLSVLRDTHASLVGPRYRETVWVERSGLCLVYHRDHIRLGCPSDILVITGHNRKDHLRWNAKPEVIAANLQVVEIPRREALLVQIHLLEDMQRRLKSVAMAQPALPG